MSSKDELVKLFKNQIKIEKTIVDSVKKGLVEIENPAVKGVLKGILTQEEWEQRIKVKTMKASGIKKYRDIQFMSEES